MSESDPRATRLAVIHDAINGCRVCESQIPGLVKPARMDRGTAGDVVVIGEGPGRAEHNQQKAFSGPSGTRLNAWLVKCGADPEAPRRRVYTTSVVKCVKETQADLPIMSRNCDRFLVQQMEVLMPQLVITVGQLAYEAVGVLDRLYGDAMCRVYRTDDQVLITRFGFHFTHVVWPHPSPLNRWHNKASNQAKLEASFERLRPFFGSRT